MGPPEFLKLVNENLIGRKIESNSDIHEWLIETKQQYDYDNQVTVTFIIDLDHNLRINDRRSEHVVCAGGLQVLSAGEMTFELGETASLKISHISNQSTGYCPDAESWKDVSKALSKTDLAHPDYFTTSFIFRICSHCHNLNVVKDNYFVCIMCESDLDEDRINF